MIQFDNGTGPQPGCESPGLFHLEAWESQSKPSFCDWYPGWGVDWKYVIEFVSLFLCQANRIKDVVLVRADLQELLTVKQLALATVNLSSSEQDVVVFCLYVVLIICCCFVFC